MHWTGCPRQTSSFTSCGRVEERDQTVGTPSLTPGQGAGCRIWHLLISVSSSWQTQFYIKQRKEFIWSFKETTRNEDQRPDLPTGCWDCVIVFEPTEADAFFERSFLMGFLLVQTDKRWEWSVTKIHILRSSKTLPQHTKRIVTQQSYQRPSVPPRVHLGFKIPENFHTEVKCNIF